MNLRQLEAFRATLRSGSITGAAKLLAISQPSVTRLIKELERSVGFPLFVRSGRGLASTVDGRRFGDAVQSMFTGTDKLRETADANNRRRRGNRGGGEEEREVAASGITGD